MKKMTAAEKIAILDVGQVWEDNNEDRYIVARIGNTPKSFCLISLISGNRWADTHVNLKTFLMVMKKISPSLKVFTS